jgi:amidophosphoribosyltransferase
MGGFFGISSKQDCVNDLYFGTDYHSHLGTMRGGMAVTGSGKFSRFIHDITNAQFKTKFEGDLLRMQGNTGIGIISDYDDQPLLIQSHLGTFAIVTVGRINNINELAQQVYSRGTTHFAEIIDGTINPTELVASLITSGRTFAEGIRCVQENIDGSCSLLILAEDGLYAARDRYGRTPAILGKKNGSYAVTSESSALPNVGYEYMRDLGPGEIVRMTPDGVEQLQAPGTEMQICAFLWVYYGYPSSSYEGINTEATRYRCGEYLADNDDTEVDLAAGIPDSGIAHAIGYANRKGVPYERPFVKYTPTWPRSFMPQNQAVRDLVARMKLLPIRELIEGKRLLFCEDSIVRGTQLKDTIQRLYACGAKEVHMRPACPPLLFGCKFLNFSRSRSELDLAGRRAINELEGKTDHVNDEYYDPDSEQHAAMVDIIRKTLKLTTLQYQRLENLVKAIGLPKEKVCTYCWDGCEPYGVCKRQGEMFKSQ